MVNLRSGALSCFGAAACMALAILLNMAVAFKKAPDAADYPSRLSPQYLTAKWDHLRETFPTAMAADFFNVAAMLLLLHAVDCLRKVYRAYGGMAQTIFYYAFLIGTMIPAVDFLQNLGARSTADWITDPTSDWQLSDANLQTVDIAWTVSNSRHIWILSSLYVFISVGQVVALYLELRNKVDNSLKRLGYLGAVCAVIGCIAFVLGIADFWNNFSLIVVYGIVLLIHGAVFLPWIIYLGIILRRIRVPKANAQQQQQQQQRR